MTNSPTTPRVAPMHYNARGNPVHTWTLTPSHMTDPVHCILPPDGACDAASSNSRTVAPLTA